MNNKYIKRLIAIFMLQVMVINIMGCDSLGGDKAANADNYEEQIIVNDWVRAWPNLLCYYDETFYFTTFGEYGEVGASENEHYCDNRLFSVERNGNEVKEISIDLSKEEPLTMITSIMVDEDTISLWLSTYDADESKPINVLIQTDYAGKEKKRTDLNALVNEENIVKALQTTQGQIVAMAEDNIYIFDETLKLIKQIEIEGRAIGMAVSKDNQLIYASEDSNDKQKLHIINVEKGKIEKTIPLKRNEAMDYNSMFASEQYDICYRTNKGIYSYDLENKKATCLLNYDKSYLVGEDIRDAISVGMDEFVIINHPSNKIESNISLYSKQDTGVENEKVTVTFGAFQFDENVKREVIAFNKANSQYEITLKEYFDEDNGESAADAIQELNEDIAKGSIPDLLDLSLLTNQYAAKGLFEDLSVYIEKDSELSEEQFVEPVFQAMKNNGKLYAIAPYFGIATLIGKKEYAEQLNGLTVEKLIAFCKEHEDKLPFYAETKADLLSILLEGCIADYYDWERGTCQFDSQEFKDVLTFCNQIMSDDNLLDGNATRNELIEQGKVLLVNESDFVPQDILTYAKMFGGEISYIGYPNKEGHGSYFAFNSQIGIYSGSDVKEGAWEFLRTLLSSEQQEKYADIYSGLDRIPVRKDCFDQLMTNLSTSQGEFEEAGEDYEVITQEQEQAFRDIVNNTNKAISYDIEMMNIIDEEAQAYFAGKKDIDKTVRIIQKRCTTYMSESK